MKLPGAANALIAIEKLSDYCLNPNHPRGRHKARVFRSALGLTAHDSIELKQIIGQMILETDCESTEKDEFGQRYTVDFPITRKGLTAEIRTIWIVMPIENFPRLTSCYVKL